MEFTGELKGIVCDITTNQVNITFSVNERSVINEIDKLKDSKLSIKAVKYRNKKSSNANAYFWALVDKLASKTNIKKEDIYRNAIKEIGGVSETICMRNEAVEKFCVNWQKKGLGWQTDTSPSKLNNCTNVVAYYGSSTYDSKQMSMLIDSIIQECKQQGIETLTSDELERLKSEWKA